MTLDGPELTGEASTVCHEDVNCHVGKGPLEVAFVARTLGSLEELRVGPTWQQESGGVSHLTARQ